MNQDFLKQFRQQLATWIETHLTEQRLPFQRLEICPDVLTHKGHFCPDIILWINRDSQLAGSMLLLPTKVDKQFLDDAVTMATPLGLGHFVTWEARDVTIWKIVIDGAEAMQTLSLPSARQVLAGDFEEVLYELLNELKIVSINTAPSTNDFNVYYFINLCIRCLDDLSAGLTDSARLSAGQSAEDEWVEQAPVEKAWMSLWRALFLLWQKRLPPGLQPDRMEQVFHYALADYSEDPDCIQWLHYNSEEPLLSNADAVRIHHLSTRLSQLGWPKSDKDVIDLVEHLLAEIGRRLELTHDHLPWPTADTCLWVGSQPDTFGKASILVAPQAYLAGVALLSMVKEIEGLTLIEKLHDLPVPLQTDKALACLTKQPGLDRKGHEAFSLLLRKVWPNRRFDFSYKTPSWIYYALFLAGSGVGSWTIILPRGWQHASDLQILWDILLTRFHLTAITKLSSDAEALCFEKGPSNKHHTIDIYRQESTFKVNAAQLTSGPKPTLVWLYASTEVNRYLLANNLICREIQWSDDYKWGAYLFINTDLGRYLWGICSDRKELPQYEGLDKTIQTHGLPLPAESMLQSLSLSGSKFNRELPSRKNLEKDFAAIIAPYSPLPEDRKAPQNNRQRTRQTTSSIVNHIIDKVFMDGTPVFPEHYLMDYYRPELIDFECDGPLSIVGEFFDKVLLQTSTGQTIEVSGKAHADALVLAASAGKKQISLPADPVILENIFDRYRSDLKTLWDNLARECRLALPRKQAAARLAQKIWQQQTLPPKDQF